MIQDYYDFEEIVELLEKNKLVIQDKFSLEDLKFIEEIIKKISDTKFEISKNFSKNIDKMIVEIKQRNTLFNNQTSL